MTIISLGRDVPILLNLGRQGDNDAQAYGINYLALRERYGEGVLTLAVKRRTDTQPYPVALDHSDSAAIWNVSATDTAIDGDGEAQFAYTVDGVVKKTVIYKTRVGKSLQPISETPPEPFDNWLDELNQMGEQIVTAKNDALTTIVAAQTSAVDAVQTATEESLTTIGNAAQDASEAIGTQGGQAVADAQTAARNANTSAQAAAASETAARGYAAQAEQYAENLHFADTGNGNITITIGGQNG